MPDRSDVLFVEQPFDGEAIEELTAVGPLFAAEIRRKRVQQLRAHLN